MPQRKEETGNAYGRLTVIEYSNNRFGNPHWRCLCSCGKEVVVGGSQLRAGTTKSCGCYQTEYMAKAPPNKIRGKWSKRLFGIWRDMIRRCDDYKAVNFKYYGGRGIKVCIAWYDFDTFASDMKEPNSLFHTIDRIDNNGNYEKSNCRWATMKEQMQNTRK